MRCLSTPGRIVGGKMCDNMSHTVAAHSCLGSRLIHSKAEMQNAPALQKRNRGVSLGCFSEGVCGYATPAMAPAPRSTRRPPAPTVPGTTPGSAGTGWSKNHRPGNQREDLRQRQAVDNRLQHVDAAADRREELGVHVMPRHGSSARAQSTTSPSKIVRLRRVRMAAPIKAKIAISNSA